MARTSTTSGPVFEVLQKNVGLPVPVSEIMDLTRLNRSQILSAISGLRAKKGFDIEPVVTGEIYRLRSLQPFKTPSSSPRHGPREDRRLFEEIGKTRDGRIIIQAAEGGLYEAKEL